jgi:hypothetical protein
MAISINYTDGRVITVNDKVKNSESTSVTFLGKGYSQGYSEIISENFLHVLENFASPNPPPNPDRDIGSPVRGQLWFNTNNLVNNDTFGSPTALSYGLKVYDGTDWLPLGVLKKSSQIPTLENAVSTNLSLGDLYVDTAKQQLYIFNESGWTLVGPQFNASEKTGIEVDVVTDANNNIARPILSVYVKTRRVAIISDQEFTPKSVIEGFPIIKQGINLTTTSLSTISAGTKFWGVSEKAETLIVGDETVDAKNFLRSDKTSTTGFGFNIRNNNGLSLGNDLSFNIGTESTGSFLYNKILGSTIDLRLKKSNAIRTVLRVSSNNDNLQRGSVGINVLAPEESLDVDGNIKTTGKLIITGSDNNSISTQGGVTIQKSVSINENLTVNGLTSARDVEPITNGMYDLGSTDKKWGTLYSNYIGDINNQVVVYGQLNGVYNGNTTGFSGGFLNSVGVELLGDVRGQFSFKTSGQNVSFTNNLAPDVITSKPETTGFVNSDVLLLERNNTLYRIKKSTMVATMPVVPLGAILLHSGDSTSIPLGYLPCNGQEVLVSEYNNLYQLVQYKFKPQSELSGPPSGISTFALPDLRSEVPISGTQYIIFTGKI